MTDLNKTQVIEILHQEFPLVLLRPKTKQPIQSGWPEKFVTLKEATQAYKGGMNIGLRLDNHFVIDFDEIAPARLWFTKFRSHIQLLTRTKKGVHIFFRNNREMKDSKFKYGDLKSGKSSQVVGPPSVVKGYEYSFADGYDNVTETNPISDELLASIKAFA